MPKLWNDTIEAHKKTVRDAALDAAASLVMRRGLSGVTMSEIAQEAGIGRATLYKYFPDVQALLYAWHERQVGRHLAALTSVGSSEGTPLQRLGKVLGVYAGMVQHNHDGELAILLHSGKHVAHAHGHLIALLSALIADGVAAGEVRTDVSPHELATFCLAAMSAAHTARPGTVAQLVELVVDTLRRGRVPLS